MKVYIAGPYSIGDVAQNVKRATRLAEYIANQGHTPFLPHLSHFWHLCYDRPYEWWLQYDLEWLAVCHVVVRLKGESNGADKEVEYAKSRNIPVFELDGFHTDEMNALDEFLNSCRTALELDVAII
jgi:hypothetical protein